MTQSFAKITETELRCLYDELFRPAIEKLSPQELVVFVADVVHGINGPEVSSRFGIPNASDLLNRARTTVAISICDKVVPAEAEVKKTTAVKPVSTDEMLTPREKQILVEVLRGGTSAAIGKTLGISTKTVETHRTSMRNKVGASCVLGLAHYALRTGLIDWTSFPEPKVRHRLS